MTPLAYSCLLIGCITLLVAIPGATAQTVPNTSPIVSKNELKQRIESLKIDKTLGDDTKARIMDLYETALKQLRDAENYELQSEIHQQTIRNSPTQLKALKKKLEMVVSIANPSKPKIFDNIPHAELEQRLTVEQGNLSAWNIQAGEVKHELRRLNNRPAEILSEESNAKKQLDDVRTELSFLHSSVNQPSPESDARKAALNTTTQSISARIRTLDLESIAHTPRMQILQAQLDTVNVRINHIQSQLQAIKAALGEQRESEAELFQEELTKALEAAEGKHHVVQDAIRKNAELGNELGRTIDKLTDTQATHNQIDTRSKQIILDFKNAEKKIELAGLSAALSAILREQRRNLPTMYDFELEIDELQKKTADASLKQFQIEEDLRLMADPRTMLVKSIDLNVDEALPNNERTQITAEVGVLLDSQKNILEKLNEAYTDYLRELGELDFANRQMNEEANQFASFLDKRLLWIPSSQPINPKSFWDLLKSASWILSPSLWTEVSEALYTALTGAPTLATLVLMVIAILLAGRPYSNRKLKAIAQRVSKRYSDRFTHTLEALTHVVLQVLPLPLLMYFPGWLLKTNHANSEMVRSVGYGLCESAISLLFLQTFYIVFRPDGLAAIHFHWTKQTLNILRRQLFWLRFVAIPAIFIISMTSSQSVATYSNSLGRFALIGFMISMVIVFAIILNPKSGVLQRYISDNSHSFLAKKSYIWYPAAIALPIIVIGFAVAGYYASALELQQKLVLSIRAIVIAIIIHAAVIRWLHLVNRQLAVKQARERHKVELTAKSAGDTPGEAGQLDFDQIDIPTINAQTRQALNAAILFGLALGFWLIWKNILPAFSILDNFVMWQQTILVDGLETHEPVTLTNLLLSVLSAIIATIAVRNLPGVLEVAVLRRFTMEPGSRYAILQLSRYLLVGIAIVTITDQLGARWSEIQWLIAALGVGLGFGLQEIFANLVSGIILLFERPIRMGDTVTVGEMTGTVTRIQIRATTLTDWDRKELIVPNKTFITDKLTNWSLSDRITRLLFPVGIAYGSDTQLAHRVISDVIHANALVLEDPEPTVFFLGFGDSSLDFEVRAFIQDVSNRLRVTHELHMDIDQALRDNKIEVPFPQRDIHIRSVVQGNESIIGKKDPEYVPKP